ncbi:peptidoglycan DD-metalloendopeptidase family protein [Candidatus Uhrbacteria bacterium]|nr:peptidoglycan DD-metalloendopeptidase family protein [Candidatus Uhrbacteria bacterium]
MNFLALLSALATMLGGAFANSPAVAEPDFAWPLDNAENRPMLLDFGMYVTPDPEQNPIDPPERWTGYHAAQDIEIFPDEIDKDVPVKAACDGKVIFKGEVNGYGGALVQACSLNMETVTVLYGHIDPGRIEAEMDQQLKAGERIGFLGDHKTKGAGYNRKHLHFQIHRGPEIVLSGYVHRTESLNSYIDPVEVIN